MLTSELRGRVLAGSLDSGPQPADYLAVQFGYKLKRVIIMLIKLVVQAFCQALSARHLEVLGIKVRVVGTGA